MARSESDQDMRGWTVQTVGGRTLGTVHDLVVDQQAGDVVLLDVDVPGSDRHAYVPRRAVRVDVEHRLVLMDSSDLPVSELHRSRAAGDGRDGRDARDARDAREIERRHMQRRKIDRLSTDL